MWVAPAGEQVAIDLRALVQAHGYLRARNTQGTQETLQHVHRADRPRRPAVQIGEQLPVAELPGRAVRCMHRSAGLAYTALAGYHHDGHRDLGSLPGRAGQALMDLLDLLGTAGEIGDVSGEQAWNLLFRRLAPDGPGWPVEGRVAGEDGVLELLQPFARLDPQFIDHGPAGLPVRLQRLGRAVAAVQGEHQLAAQSFSQRMLLDEFGELADQFVVPAQVKFKREPVFVGGNALLVQPACGRPQERAVDTLKRGAAPEPERIAVARDGPVKVTGVASRASGHGQFVEPLGVKLAISDLDDVALTPRGNGVGVTVRSKQAPQRRNGDLRLRTGS
jgi:hypothetical protein